MLPLPQLIYILSKKKKKKNNQRILVFLELTYACSPGNV
jgi:hypothetical protein